MAMETGRPGQTKRSALEFSFKSPDGREKPGVLQGTHQQPSFSRMAETSDTTPTGRPSRRRPETSGAAALSEAAAKVGVDVEAVLAQQPEKLEQPTRRRRRASTAPRPKPVTTEPAGWSNLRRTREKILDNRLPRIPGVEPTEVLTRLIGSQVLNAEGLYGAEQIYRAQAQGRDMPRRVQAQMGDIGYRGAVSDALYVVDKLTPRDPADGKAALLSDILEKRRRSSS